MQKDIHPALHRFDRRPAARDRAEAFPLQSTASNPRVARFRVCDQPARYAAALLGKFKRRHAKALVKQGPALVTAELVVVSDPAEQNRGSLAAAILVDHPSVPPETLIVRYAKGQFDRFCLSTGLLLLLTPSLRPGRSGIVVPDLPVRWICD